MNEIVAKVERDARGTIIRTQSLAEHSWDVDGSAYCIAHCTRNSGGTAYTLRYAQQEGLKIYNVAGGYRN